MKTFLRSAIAVTVIISPSLVLAAEANVNFKIPAQSTRDALKALALQAGISIADRSEGRCAGATKAVNGFMSLRQALDRVLAGSACTYRFIDPHAVLVFAALTTPKAPPASITPTETSSEVVVLADRQPASISRSPYSVTKLDRAALRDGGVSETSDIAPLVAGMTVTNLGPGRDKIFLRGLSDGVLTGRTQSTVGLYLDDVAISYDAPDPDLRLVDVAAVEVLRGPQGALYGAGPIAGVVQYQTNRPSLTTYSADLAVEAAATEGGAPSRSVEGVLNLPIISGRVGLRLVAYDQLDGGYIDNIDTNRDNVNTSRRSGGRAVVRFDLSPALSVNVGGVFQSLSSADSQYDTAGLPLYERAVRIAEPHDNDFAEAFGQLRWRGDGLELKSTTALIRHVLDSRYDATAALPLLAAGVPGVAAYDEALHKRLLTQDTTLSTVAGRDLQWSVGFFYLRAAEGDVSALSSLQTGDFGGLYREDRESVEETYAIYGETTRRLLPRVFLTIGARAFRTSADVDAVVHASDGVRRVALSQHTSGVAPKVVARFDATSALTIYAQATEGYRGGGVNTAGLAGQALPTGLAGRPPFLAYRGDQLWNYEIGLRGQGWGGAAQFHLAAFYASWRNLQSDQLLPSGLPYTANLGFAINKGVEAEGRLDIGAFALQSNLTWNNPELVAPGPGFTSLRDASLPAISRLSGGVAVGYRRRLTDSSTLHLGLDLNYVDRSKINLFTNGTVMGGYTKGRASIGLDGPRWRLQLSADNLFGRPANTFAYGNPFTAPQGEQITPLRPRTFTVRLSAHF